MTLLSHVAQNCMDLYYQNHAADEDFFELYHFTFLCAAAYHAILQNDYEKSYQLNVREGGASAVISEDWYIAEPVTIDQDCEEYRATLKQQVFSFRYDTQTLGLGPVLYSGRNSCVRITIKELYKLDLAPFTRNVYVWLVAGSRQLCFTGNQVPGKATVLYVPVCDPLNENAAVADSMVDAIIRGVLQLMMQAKGGRPFVNMSNDQNPNVNPEGELVTTLRRILGVSKD